MAKVDFNATVAGVRGRVGSVILRRQNGKNVMVVPSDDPLPPASARQQGTRDNFSLAAQYAKAVLEDPLQREMYRRIAKQRNSSLQGILIRDFMNPPRVEQIETAGFTGQAGDLIKVIASDDLAVASVEVILRDAHGTVLEQGAAAPVHEVWVYRATTTRPAGERITIEAVARDRPGHEGTAISEFPK